ncbi:reprolysin-like metallopeptidase [Abyssalbus ytuae]|uniref:M12 family metallo-peptidase n=1 Tax=Abyssalbus ytuae TaxID=2926907 RepID=A0A9E7CY27_9FLAO|nr:zinc-dependent metalloprotease family protein [Abyssalbus ytuae]UOB16195.1 M12 family metallo-peptidase [Abyssalbus ytuae]
MIKKVKILVLFFATFTISQGVSSQEIDVWKLRDKDHISEKSINSARNYYDLDIIALKEKLSDVPKRIKKGKAKKSFIYFPMPDGSKELYEVFEHSVLSEKLSSKYPEIKSYYATSVNNSLNTIRFSVDNFGFHGMVFHKGSAFYINPAGDDLYYLAAKNDFQEKDFTCTVDDNKLIEESLKEAEVQQRAPNDGQLRTFRLALACTAEYAAFHISAAGLSAGTTAQQKAAVLSAMNTTMTRVNGIFEKEISVTMELVDNNDDLIFLDTATDGYTNSDASEMIDENQEIIDDIIGLSNYDIGHVFSRPSGGGSGLAQVGCPCTTGKARGVTGLENPVGDAFDVDFVCHEMGHQYGATHTFNNSCSNNRTNITAVEPGSGSTIMSYAGICSPLVAENASPYFHTVSITQMWLNITEGNSTCAAPTTTGNSVPVVSAGNDYTIPKGTPFVLKGEASDSDGDNITYCWEQIDNQVGEMPPVSTAESGPVFRSRLPVTSPYRYFPQTQDILDNNLSPTWEVIPTVGRELNFSLLVRDNNTTGGQSGRDDMKIIVDDNSGPFMITSQTTSSTFSEGEIMTITWDVANTTLAPVNAEFVDIYFIVNGDFDNPVSIEQSVPNDGSQSIVVPTGLTSSAVRVMIKGSDNIFFAINEADFTIQQSEFVLDFDAVDFNICNTETGFSFQFTYNTFGGFNEVTSFTSSGEPSGLSVSFNPTTAVNNNDVVEVTVSGTDNLAMGSYSFAIQATSGSTTLNYPIGLNIFSPVVEDPVLLLPLDNSVDLPKKEVLSWQEDTNALQYEIQISESVNFSTITEQGATIANAYAPQNLEYGSQYFWRVKTINDCGESSYSTPFSFTTINVSCVNFVNDKSISIDNVNANTITSVMQVPYEGKAENITVELDISHTWVEDLTVNLTSPTGKTVTLLSGQCGDGQNIKAVFDDEASFLTCLDNPVISGNIKPVGTLSSFKDEEINGGWTLTVIDGVTGDGGALNSFSINICIQGDEPILNLPANNFTVSSLSESCVGNNDGEIKIETFYNLNFTASLLTGGSSAPKQFSTETQFTNLSAGEYQVCVTLDEEPDFEQCFTLNLKQPESLSVFSKVDTQNKVVNLNMEGGTTYNIELNGEIITQTSQSNIVVSLKEGVNLMKITTNKECQGLYEEEFFIFNNSVAYPNPFDSKITFNTRYDNKLITLIIYTISGEKIYQGSLTTDQAGEASIDLNNLPEGIYFATIKGEGIKATHKIIKQ